MDFEAPGNQSLETVDGDNRMLPIAPFGGFQWVDLLLGFRFGDQTDMGGHVAVSDFPFQAWVWATGAIGSRWKLDGAVTPPAGFHYFQASAAVVGASRLGHKGAVGPLSNRRANHFHHLIKILILLKKKGGGCPGLR